MKGFVHTPHKLNALSRAKLGDSGWHEFRLDSSLYLFIGQLLEEKRMQGRCWIDTTLLIWNKCLSWECYIEITNHAKRRIESVNNKT